MPNPLSTTATYFVTSIVTERWPLFKKAQHAELLIETLQHYRQAGHYKLHAYVVMPDHIHLLITPIDITIERAMQFIKGGFSKRVEFKGPVWQKSFSERRMRDADEFIARKEYILQNPVRAGMVQRAEDYAFSSAFRKRTSAAKAEVEEGS